MTLGLALTRPEEKNEGESAPPHPAGEGLRWVAHGFSALGLSDREILEREFVVYDALYAECQRRSVTR